MIDHGHYRKTFPPASRKGKKICQESSPAVMERKIVENLLFRHGLILPRRERSGMVIGMAGHAIVADPAPRTVAIDARLDRREMEIRGLGALFHLMTIDTC